jgi:hypothetical protein
MGKTAEELAQIFSEEWARPIVEDTVQAQKIAGALAMPEDVRLRRVRLPYKLGGAGSPPGRPPKYPWRTMAVSESFEFKCNNRSASIFCIQQGRKLGRIFKRKGNRIYRLA